jgi:RHS repeat-associated protein
MTREQIVVNGPGGAAVSGAIIDPWQSEPTATRGAVTARRIGTKATHTWVALDGGRGVRRTTSISQFDGNGHITQTEDQGDDADPNDSRCTKYSYVNNTTAWLIDLVSRTESYALACGQVATRAEDVISDVRTSYDDGVFGATPVRGDPTQVETLKEWAPGGGTYSVTSRSKYDAYGRTTDMWDAAGKHTGTAFEPASGPVTKITTTGPLGFRSITEIEPAWGATVRSTDANNKVTQFTLDPLNRVTEVYQPGRVKGTDTPSASMTYQMRNDGTTATSVSRLGPNGKYSISFTIYDSLLRQREVQKPSPAGGRIIVETLYDSAGRATRAYGPYHSTGSPGVDLVTATDPGQVATQTVTMFDGADRQTASIFKPYDKERWRTSTYYGGDHTDVTPQAGAFARATYTDARGQTVALHQYQSNQPSGVYDTTTYHYDGRGYRTEVIDSGGNRWSFTYDVRGRETGGVDPDSGTSVVAYDDVDRVLYRQDGRGQKLTYGYDDLGRTVSLSDSAGTQLATWTYDTLAKGYLTSSTRYVNGNAYTVAVRGYTDLYNSTGTTVTIPTAEGKLAGTYQYQTTYNVDGSPATVTYPRAGGLAPETVMYGYGDSGELKSVGTLYDVTESTYVTDIAYDPLARLSQYRFSTGTGGNVYQSFTYEIDTARITDVEVSRDSRSPNVISHLQYDYEPAGAITKVSEQPGSGATDTQCFTHDYLQRLTEAWTPAGGDCGAAPSAGLGGPSPYWESWSFDLSGGRRNQTLHNTTAGDVSTDYDHPTAGSAQPHRITGTTRRDNTGSTTQTYDYDRAGNVISRPGSAGQQTLAWDVEGHLSSVTDSTGKSDYVYDADDRRLIAHDPAGTTLYLPNTELRLDNTTKQVTATRYYMATGGIVCQRTSAGVTWLIADQHSTSYLAIASATQVETRRRLDPYGNPRAGNGTWPNPRGFVGGDNDLTGLTHLGAREYDPGTGSFVSVDPKIDLTAPETLNPYVYSANNPVNFSDPDGLSWLSGLVKTLKAANNGTTWAGIGMMVLGGMADAGGGLLIATGVGAPLGAALEVVGTDAIVAGAVTATAGIVAGSAQNIMNNDSGGGTGGTPSQQPHPDKAEADKLLQEHNAKEGGDALSETNAYKALEDDAPEGAHPVAKGKSEAGSDIDFVDSSGNVVLRREVKTASSKNAFEKQLAKGSEQVDYDGDVFIQVPRGTTTNQIRSWLTRFRSQPKRDIARYSKVRVKVRNQDGVDLGTYNAAQEPPPPPHHIRPIRDFDA